MPLMEISVPFADSDGLPDLLLVRVPLCGTQVQPAESRGTNDALRRPPEDVGLRLSIWGLGRKSPR